MLVELTFEQATAAVQAGREVRWLAQSPDFQDDWKSAWEPHLLAAARRLGATPCPEGFCVRPLPQKHVGICRLTDLDGDPPTVRGIQLLVLPEAHYRAATGDPFAILEACPANWHARGSLANGTLPLPLPRRTVEQICDVLKTPDSPALFGAAQALVDGGRVAWIRAEHDPLLLKRLWLLLPTSTRWDLWPASWAVGTAKDHHAVLLPRAEKGDFDHRFLSEAQVTNYPEGRYEYGVQAAAEAGDQALLDQLFARRSRAETWRLGLWIAGALIVLITASAGLKWLMGR
jgi:hypothetical protein